MREHKWILITVVLVAVAGFLAWNLFVSERARRAAMEQEAARPIDLETEAIVEESIGTAEITLHFPRPGRMPGSGDFLQTEPRQVPAVQGSVLRARQIVLEVLRGPRPAGDFDATAPPPDSLPEVRLRQVFLLDEGTAVIDLHSLDSGFPPGITEEYALVASLTRSLKANLEEIQQVKFLVEGKDQATLAGHVSLERPFR